MKKVILSIATILLTVLSVTNAKAEGDEGTASHAVSINIEDFALLAIEGPGNSTSISLKPSAPSKAGESITFGNDAKDNSLWLNYTSVVSTGRSRKITAKVNGTLPKGIDLLVKAGEYKGNGKGEKGDVSNGSAQKLTSGEAEIIKGIKSVYTGAGINNGYNLEYSLRFQDGSEENAYKLLEAGTYTINVTYTIKE